ncbi:MAG TPA: hypothetical protein DDW52_16945 [Planctomycetaceae bacterium]|nr:hypothetical protein [Planctomycetaceae bacterium]
MGEQTTIRPMLLTIALAVFGNLGVSTHRPCMGAAFDGQQQQSDQDKHDRGSAEPGREGSDGKTGENKNRRGEPGGKERGGKGGRNAGFGDHRRSGRNGDPFFEAVSETFLADADLQMYRFALDRKVADHLQLGEETKTYLKQQLTGYFSKISDWKKEYRENADTITQLRDTMRKEAEQARSNIQEHLNSQGKLEGLFSVYIQARGAIAAAVTPIANEIGLKQEELKQFRQAKEDAWHRMMDKLRDEMRHILRQRIEDRRNYVAKLHKRAAQQLELTLSRELGVEMRLALEKLAGEKIPNIDEFQRLRRMPFMGSGRGPGGPPNHNGGGRKPGEGNPPVRDR